MDYSRLAALKVATLNQTDQAWILSALPNALAQTMRERLQELSQLGIQNPAEVLDTLLQQEQEAINKAKNAQRDELQACIDHYNSFSASDIKLLLKRLPVTLAAIFTALHPWSWRTDVKGSANIASSIHVNAQLLLLKQVKQFESEV